MGFVRRLAFALVLAFGALTVSPPIGANADQPVAIRGIVVDAQTGDPLSGALVSVGANFHPCSRRRLIAMDTSRYSQARQP